MAAGREGAAVLLLALVLAFSGAQGDASACGDCGSTVCPELDDCEFGVVKDACGCCSVCARGLGQLCDGPSTHNTPGASPVSAVYGGCGEYLVCAARTDVGDTSEHTCQCSEEGQVCGSDGITYEDLCHLLSRAYEFPDLHVALRGPCMAAPRIRSRPQDTVRPIGSILVLDCEVVGHPVPTITWELNKPDGSSLELPSDKPAFAVQVRGGPENNMATGWVQIMRISEETLGIYTCVATNSEGQARASAKVTELKPGSKNYPKKA